MLRLLKNSKSNEIKLNKNELTLFERDEIKTFSKNKLFYYGELKNKVANGKKNDNFDDTNEHYIIRKNDHIYYRYKIIDKLGAGQYGSVIKAQDMKYNTPCAIKIIRNNPRYLFMCRQEIDILIKLLNNLELMINEKEKIILIRKEFDFRNHLCIVTNLYYLNLYKYRYDFGFLPMTNNYKIIRDIFQGLKYLKQNNIIHGDLKPENIFLYDDTCENAVIGDFGLSLYNKRIKTNTNIQSMWYRAPEIIYNIDFDFAVDIWSLGGIIYELITSKELFRAKNEGHLLIVFHEILGLPDNNFINSNPKISRFYDNSGYPKSIHINGKVRSPNSRNIRKDIYLYELMMNCFEWDSKKRIDYDKAIKIIENELYQLESTSSPKDLD